MNSKQRNKNRATARSLRLAQHTCENCGEKGGHWVSTRGSSVAALLMGVDDQEGFWTCPKLYTATGRRIVEHKLPIHPLPPEPVSKRTIRMHGRYNWKGQPERLVYVGCNWSGNGFWHQFEKVDKPGEVWCEVLDSDLPHFELTKVGDTMRS